MNSLNYFVDMDPAMDEIGSICDVGAPVLPAEAVDMIMSSTEAVDSSSSSGNSSAMNLLNSADVINSVQDCGDGIRSVCDEVSSLSAADAISVDLF